MNIAYITREREKKQEILIVVCLSTLSSTELTSTSIYVPLSPFTCNFPSLSFYPRARSLDLTSLLPTKKKETCLKFDTFASEISLYTVPKSLILRYSLPTLHG